MGNMSAVKPKIMWCKGGMDMALGHFFFHFPKQNAKTMHHVYYFTSAVSFLFDIVR